MKNKNKNTIELIKRIINSIENNKKLKDHEIEDILNNIDYVVVYNFTNNIGHLTLTGKNAMVQKCKVEILNELYRYIYIYIYWNETALEVK